MAETKSVSPSGVLRFGVFQANLPARELRKHSVRVRLSGQPFCILSMLLEKPGEIVTREEMRQRLWASDTFVDFEHSLNSAIKKLRAALGDSPDNSRYVETIPRVGYRFVAPVEQVSATAPSTVNVPVVSDYSAAPAASVIRTGKRGWKVLLGVVLIVAPGAYFGWSRFRNRPQPQSKMAGKIRTATNGRESNSPTSSPKSAEARDLYLKGMYFWNQRNVPAFRQAIVCFQQAIAADRNYAPAYSGLANSYTLLTAYSDSIAPTTLYMAQARVAALRALELDDHLAEAHTALALIVQNQDWDWKTSENEYRRAIELNPGYPTAHHWYAEHLMWLGRFDEALEESERARKLDPLSLIIATDHGAILYFSRQYDRAIEQSQTVFRKNPNFPRAIYILIHSYTEKGLFREALTQAEMYRRFYGDGPFYWSALAYVHGRAGQLERGQYELEKLQKFSRQEQMSSATMLWAHLGVGNKEEALADLEKAYAEHSNLMTYLKVEPAFDPLRSDPRFQDLLQRVGLANSESSGGGGSKP